MIGCKAFVEHYRCPEEFVPFRGHRSNDAPQGFFKFGENVVCYGHCSWGNPRSYLNGNLTDVWTTIHANGGITSLPFDPDEVLDNLRRERYVTATNGDDDWRSTLLPACRGLYYRLRPALPPFLRVFVKKAYLAGWEKTPFPRWPIDITVDRLLEQLLKLSLEAQENTDIPFIWFWPDGYDSCSIMTHDVESSAGRDFIRAVRDLDLSAGIKASFQIIPEERYTFSEKLLCEIRSQGFEVNIHDLNHDGRLFDNQKEFLIRARRINDYSRKYGAIGYRSGAMYRNQDWYDAFGFEYDMSVPNVAHLDPQHGGCCTVMPYFIGHILELPLTTVQDHFLFHILKDDSIDLWKRQIETIRRRHGMISFIVHPDDVIADHNRGKFISLLEYLAVLRESGTVWFALPGEVNRWWRQRREMRLIRDGSDWKIQGQGSERARIAYAYLAGGKVTYRIGQRRSVSDSAEEHQATDSRLAWPPKAEHLLP